ncbi:solute carrier family 23 member 2-like [Saccostrea cucullata]|uniref:solute carrier family 23 member 2-like n=1 Tax=Saccostrea cuccullata TaxID=36930 RepID=UPI002ED43681
MGSKDDSNKNSKMIKYGKDGEYSLESDKLVNETGLVEGDSVVEIKDERQNQLLYKVADHPPVYLTIFCGLQHTLISLSGNMAISLLVADVTCAAHMEDIKTTLLSSTLLMSGVVTVFMTLIGSRLPLFQGAASDYLIPLLALQVLDKTRCDFTDNINPDLNSTSANTSIITDHREKILNNIRELQGSLVAAGAFQCLLGATGLVSLLLKFIGPITIVPTLFLSCIFIVRACVKFASVHWGVALLVTAVSLILSLYLSHHNTPIPMWTRKKGFHILWFPLHQVYSILIGILVGWMVCGIMTVSGAFDPYDKLARTDTGISAIRKAAWFRIPYPGQFGPMSFSTSVFTGFLIGTITSTLDSIGDYYACAKMSNVPPPPSHSVNRGIAMEGFFSLIAGLMGCGHATTTYGGNIGAIGVTKVASRDVFLAVGLIYIVFGIIGKVSAVFLSIPYPVLGGALIVMFGMFNGVVLSNLQVVSLSSSRNLAIIGTSILFGLMIPYWLEINPDAIQTGSPSRDSIIKMLMVNPNLCGGIIACLLDNTVRGTLKERGIEAWQQMIGDKAEDGEEFDYDLTIYDIPLSQKMKKSKLLRRLPFMPPQYN